LETGGGGVGDATLLKFKEGKFTVQDATEIRETNKKLVAVVSSAPGLF